MVSWSHPTTKPPPTIPLYIRHPHPLFPSPHPSSPSPSLIRTIPHPPPHPPSHYPTSPSTFLIPPIPHLPPHPSSLFPYLILLQLHVQFPNALPPFLISPTVPLHLPPLALIVPLPLPTPHPLPHPLPPPSLIPLPSSPFTVPNPQASSLIPPLSTSLISHPPNRISLDIIQNDIRATFPSFLYTGYQRFFLAPPHIPDHPFSNLYNHKSS
jgi:hypothetical protein